MTVLHESADLDAQGRNPRGALVPTGGRSSGAAVIGFCVAASVVPVAYILMAVGDAPPALNVVAAASIIFGLLAFLRHGGREITAPGIYYLTSGVMVGGASWYWARNPAVFASMGTVAYAAISAYATTVVAWLICARRSEQLAAGIDEDLGNRDLPPVLTAYMLRWGVTLFVLGAGAGAAHVQFGGMTDAAAFVGAVLYAGSVLMHGNRQTGLRMRDSVALLGVVAYYLFVFSGNGRLVLVALLFSTAGLAQYRHSVRLKKFAVISMVPALIAFSMIGQSRISGTVIQDNAGGLGSVVNPLATFGYLVENDFHSYHGSTFLAEVVLPVPRSLWPTKPVQAGRTIALLLNPNSGTYGQSSYALAAGEWYLNFGWLGVVAGAPLLALLLRWLDRRYSRRRRQIVTTRRQLLALVAWAILAGSVSDLAWGGTQTWTTRAEQRMLVLLPIALIAYISESRRR